ncbi:MAG: hypothetical protein IPO88_00565 [Nannocystis sp.]|uniref:hypothetical protein n=1 Tax=Nannocystis sp. TaxID=1962667 RepID=UPI0024263C84|nr:hypothetical protein [Nannocystis sp.]MBK9751996.1 hypothetical protein [Nannocystis sp.]
MRRIFTFLLSGPLSVLGCTVGGGGGPADGDEPGQPDTQSCFSAVGQAALADSSGATLADLEALHEVTPREVRLAVVFWAAALDAQATGQMRPEFGEAGLYDAMFALGAGLPGVDPTASACQADADPTPRAGEMYPCARTCAQHGRAFLDSRVPEVVFELVVSKYSWMLELSKDVVVLKKVRAIVDLVATALANDGELDATIDALGADLDALGDLLVSQISNYAGKLVNTLSGATWLFVASAGYTVYTLYRDYRKVLAACAAEQAMCVAPGETGAATTDGFGETDTFGETSTFGDTDTTGEPRELVVSERDVPACVIDSNAVKDDLYDMYLNGIRIGAVDLPVGGTVCHDISLLSGANLLELRLVAENGQSTLLQIDLNSGEAVAEFQGSQDHVWNVVAP